MAFNVEENVVIHEISKISLYTVGVGKPRSHALPHSLPYFVSPLTNPGCTTVTSGVPWVNALGGGTSGVMSQNIWGTIFARERSDRALGGGCPPPMVRSFILFRLENVQSGEYLRRKFRLDDMYYISKLVWNWILFWRASAPKPPPPTSTPVGGTQWKRLCFH